MTEREMWVFGIMDAMLYFAFIAWISSLMILKEQEKHKKQKKATPPIEKNPKDLEIYRAGLVLIFALGVVGLILLPGFWSTLLKQQKIGFAILLGMIVFMAMFAFMLELNRILQNKNKRAAKHDEKDSHDE